MTGISMVVTTFNRHELLHHSMPSWGLVTCPDEIIVVDDGGADGLETKNVCEFWREIGLPVTYVRNERPEWGNRSQPTNVGIRLVSTEYVLCTDPEVVFLTDVVGQFHDAAKHYPDNILAPWNGYHDTSPDCELDECLLACPGNGLHDNGGNAFLYRKSWIEEIGGFDEDLEPGAWDDIDLHTRLAWSGHVQIATPFTDIRHRWHPEIPWNAGDSEYTESSLRNKARVEAKRFPQDLVANKDREWGTVLT